MGEVLQSTHNTGPPRWKLFLFVMFVMGSLTAAAIVLTLKAHPRRETVRVPPPQPVSLFVASAPDHQSPPRAL